MMQRSRFLVQPRQSWRASSSAWLLLALALVIAPSPAVAEEPAPQKQRLEDTVPDPAPQPTSNGKKLKIISYNVQFLPGPGAFANKRKSPIYRARMVGTLLSEFDLIGLNEVFEQRPRDQLLAQLKKSWGDHYQELVIPKPDDERFMGGLAIAGRSEFLATHHLLFSQGSSVKKYGLLADGFAAKGVLHARVWRGGTTPKTEFVDVFITHLESKEEAIREIQYRELSDFVRAHADPAHPTLVMGDMNTRGNPRYQTDTASAYRRMLKIYNEARPELPFVDLWPKLHGEALGATTEQESTEVGNRIDYIFLSNPPTGHSRLEPKSLRVNGYLDEKVTALSDHSAVEGELEWVDAE